MHEFLPFLFGLTMQVVFLLSFAYAAYAICQRWFSAGSIGVRWCATCIVFCWLLSVLFGILVTAGLFAPLPATAVALVVLVLTSRGRLKPRTWLRCLANDLSHCGEIMPQKADYAGEPGRPRTGACCSPAVTEGDSPIFAVDQRCASVPGRENWDSPPEPSLQDGLSTHSWLFDSCLWWAAMTGFSLLAVLLTVRTLALPLLGWDAITYHAVKAGMWVQSGRWTALIAPGGWESALTLFGGGEAFTAWAMLFLHHDLLAGIPDVFFWGLLGLTTAGLATEFGLPGRTSALVGLAFLCTIDLGRLVGSGYVDTCGNAFLLAGVLFLLRFERSKQAADFYLSAAAFGLASSVKFNMFAATVLLAIPAVVLLLRAGRPWIGRLALGVLALAAPIAPWLGFNYWATGYPLGCIPLRIGPLHLGAMPPNLALAVGSPTKLAYDFAGEEKALSAAVATYGFTLLLIVLGLPGIALRVRQFQRRYVLAFLAIVAVLGLYFSPWFTPVRLGWAGVNGRFLTAALVLIAAAGLPLLQGYRCGTLLIQEISAVAILCGTWSFLNIFVYGRPGIESFFLAAAVGLMTLGYFLIHHRRWFASSAARSAVAGSLLAVAVVGGMYAVLQFKDSFRIRAYSECMIMHRFPNYWVDGLHVLESEPGPLRIAFTYGPASRSHGAFIAPFLGPRLQNHLMYVSPQADGALVGYGADYAANANPSFEAWVQALRKAGATHLLCLEPPCTELKWAEDHPDLFVNLVQQNGHWGLFRIQWPNEAAK